MADKPLHPLYSQQEDNWELCRDSLEGETAIKSRGTKYLPATSGQIADGALADSQSVGAKSYSAYKLRAVYPEIYSDAVEAALGIMHRKPPVISVPTALEGMLDNATKLGESLRLVLRNINARQLATGRLGVVGDIVVNEDGKATPVVVLYEDVHLLNWDVTKDGAVKFVILDETTHVMGDDFNWQEKVSYRVLALTNGEQATLDDNGTYTIADMEPGDSIAALAFNAPAHMGTNSKKIPFSFCNASDIAPEPAKPPFLSLANSCLTIYRGEADYRQNLFMQGQDTLVRVGAIDDGETVRTGAGARIDVPIGGDAKYIGVSATGLSEQRQALEHDYERAMIKAGQALNQTGSKESGEALRIRIAAQTATLPQIARAGAAALERVLKVMAEWFGANPDEVEVKPNLEFTEKDLNGQTLVQIMTAKGLGAPISLESIHGYMREKGVTNMTLEEEQAAIANEQPGEL